MSPMAQTAAKTRTSYPLVLYNFRVKVAEVSMSFTEISGIVVQYGSVTYRHGLSFFEGEDIQTFQTNVFAPVTCKRGLILGAQPTYLYEWLQRRELRSMDVSLCDSSGTPVLSWKIAAAVPVKLEAPAFGVNSNDAAIETLELRVRGVSIVKR